jgi:type IV fimbrial biogenesis protein FimT
MLGVEIGRDLLNMISQARQLGVSLIELVIGLAIIGVMLVVGMPEMNMYMANTRVNTAANAFLSGIQQARAEAVKRNLEVEFIQLQVDANSGNSQVTSTSTTGQNWMVRVRDPLNGLYTMIDGRNAAEGAMQNVTVTGSVGKVVFTPVSVLSAEYNPSAVTFEFKNPSADVCAPTGKVRCLNVVVSRGGLAKLCDPTVTAVGDSRSC